MYKGCLDGLNTLKKNAAGHTFGIGYGWRQVNHSKGFIYKIMERTRHRYHYAVRCCKRNVLELQKLKIAETVTNSSQFWIELKKINPSHRISTLKIDNAVGKVEIAELLAEKYKYLYKQRTDYGVRTV